MSEEKKVEQDEREAHLQLLDEVLEAKSVMLAAGCKQAKFGEMFAEYARAASTSANGDRFDPYRLKVAEECCERLMSACTDAGCPDGVRMDDWIRENVRSTSANVAQGAEAVREQIARALHYPACWDTAAYPTLDSAAWEAIACAKLGCSTCGELK